MAWIVFFVLVITIPVGLLWWRRRDSGPGADGHDPHGHRDIARDGGEPPGPYQRGDWGAGGNV